MLKQINIFFLLTATILAETTYFDFQTNAKDPEFVIEFTDEHKIQHIRAYLSGEKVDPHIKGRIIKGIVPYNRLYKYHIAPDAVEFFNEAEILIVMVIHLHVIFVLQHL